MAKYQLALAADFLSSFDRLERNTKNKVENFINRFQQNPKSKGINFERVQKARDKNIRLARIDRKYRLVLRHPEQGNIYIILWVDNHDEAIKWAQHKVVQLNAITHSLQIFSTEKIKQELLDSPTIPPQKTGLFANISDKELKKCGLAELLIPAVRDIKSLDDLMQLQNNLAEEVFEALNFLAQGYSVAEVLSKINTPRQEDHTSSNYESAIKKPQSARRIVLVESREDLHQMLSEPLEKWRIFLHPTQRHLAQGNFNGPVRVLGGPGTGKTVVALHRANFLAQNSANKILLTTFTANLAENLKKNLATLASTETLAQIEVKHINAWIIEYLKSKGETYKILQSADLKKCWETALSRSKNLSFPENFYRTEWEQFVAARGIDTFEAYLKADRKGQRIPLNAQQRTEFWQVFQNLIAVKNEKQQWEWFQIFIKAREYLENDAPPYDAVIVDEGQDMDYNAFRLIRQLVEPKNNDIFIVGDSHQRVYGIPVILKKCGINIKGRSYRLWMNYRTTEEIQKWSLNFLNGVAGDDFDGKADSLAEYYSLLKGSEPKIKFFKDSNQEIDYIAEQILNLSEKQNVENICLSARTKELVKNYETKLIAKGIPCRILDKNNPPDKDGCIRLGTIHRIKGLEYPIVFIVGINNQTMPLTKCIQYDADGNPWQESLNGEKRLLFVAATRARDLLFITGSGEISPFFEKI